MSRVVCQQAKLVPSMEGVGSHHRGLQPCEARERFRVALGDGPAASKPTVQPLELNTANGGGDLGHSQI